MTPLPSKDGVAKVEGPATYKSYPKGLMADVFINGEQFAYSTVPQAKIWVEKINRAIAPILARADLAGRMYAAIAHYKMMKVNEDIGPYLDEFDALLAAWDSLQSKKEGV